MPYAEMDVHALRRALDIPRDTAATLGREAVEILRSGAYRTADETLVEVCDLVDAARRRTVEYGPDDAIPPPAGPLRANGPRIDVRNTTTLEAAHRLLRSGHAPAALNFASPTHPGGGFLSGARAQEEYLARSSALHACLDGRRMYEHCRGLQDPFKANFVIVSPRVPVFRDDDGRLLHEPWCCTMITSPAVHASGVRSHAPDREVEIEPTMRRRIGRVLAAAAAHGERALVLGAWGCGAFGNDPGAVARLFREALEGEIGRHFDEVVFAVTDWSDGRRFIGPFERELG